MQVRDASSRTSLDVERLRTMATVLSPAGN
jgi:hypothetical protein